MGDRTRRRVVVTGAARGFGLAVAGLFASAGADVLAVVKPSRSSVELANTGATVIEVDLVDPGASQIVADAVAGRPLDLLVNNAAAAGASFNPAAIDAERLRYLLELHVVCPARIITALWPSLLSATGQVVNVSSRMGSLTMNELGDFRGMGATYEYRVSKAALNMLSVCVGADAASEGVTFLAVHPGRLRTAMGVEGADFDPNEAASRLAHLLERKPRSGLIDLETGAVLPW